MITGILPVDKPLGWTSHDVVARIRRVIGQRQVGHAGTLDPLATGLLLVVLGKATRFSSYLMASPKIYVAEMVLGATTTTDDAEGCMQNRADVSHLSRSDVALRVSHFVGEIDQVPPLYAAVKRGGEKLYVLARKGETVRPEARRVTVYSIDMQDWQPPRLRIRVQCGQGTYIRSLARDIGAALGVGGYLHALRRTVSGTFTVAGSCPLDTLRSIDDVREQLRLPERAVLDWPAVVLNEIEVRSACSGRRIQTHANIAGQVRLYDSRGGLLGLGEAAHGTIRPFHILAGE